jgi:hypothetical protein
VFTTDGGNPMDRHDMAQRFQRLCLRAGIGDHWVPRELRTSYASAMSAAGVPVEMIGHTMGHSTTATTERVYRKELRPVLREGGHVMNELGSDLGRGPVMHSPTSPCRAVTLGVHLPWRWIFGSCGIHLRHHRSGGSRCRIPWDPSGTCSSNPHADAVGGHGADEMDGRFYDPVCSGDLAYRAA